VQLLRESALSVFQARRAISSLLLLRLADNRDAEQEAMAAFEEIPWKPILAARLRWRNLAKAEVPQQLADRLLELSSVAVRLREEVSDPVANHLHMVAEPLRELLKLKPFVVQEVVSLLDSLPLDTASDRRAALTYFDRDVLEMRSIGDGVFASPPPIAHLVAVLAKPRPDDRVYDPCFGIGNLLLSLWQFAEGSGRHSRRSGSILQVSGVEISDDAFVIGLTRMLLGGVDAPGLERGDALERTTINPARTGFDLVVADPPWGTKVGARHNREPWRYQHFQIATSDATGFFIQHALSQLNPNGRAVVVVPEGFLSRGSGDRELRRKLIEAGQVEAVVGLPPGVHATHTQLKSCVLLLNKAGGASRIRMVDASPFFEKQSSRAAPTIKKELAIQLAAELVRPEVNAIDVNTVFVQRGERGSERLESVVWEVSPEELSVADWDLTPRRRESGGLDDILSNLATAFGDQAQVVMLSEVARVIAGRSINTKDLVDVAPADRPIPYVRIRDVTQGRITRPTNWLSAEASDEERSNVLLAGDLLLSKSGTIGKAAMVTNGSSGAIAASGFYVLRATQSSLDPKFLLAYLNSPACQNWLAARARGAVIQHLNRSALDKLPVLLPPMALQARAAAQHRDFGGDVLVFLGEATGTAESDRLNSWVAELSSKIPATVDLIDEVPSLSLVDPLVEIASGAQRWIEQEEMGTQQLRWLAPLTATLLNLRGLAQIPPGPSLLTVLQEAERGFQAAVDRAAGHLPIDAQARGSAEKLSRWMRAAVSNLIARTKIGLRTEIGHLNAGSFAEFAVELVNEGDLPLRALAVESVPDWGTAEAEFLPEQASLKVNLRGDVPRREGTFSLQLRWSARDLNSRRVSGEIELALPVTTPSNAGGAQVVELGGSPYVTGDPLAPQHGHDVFFGREQLLSQIARQISLQGNVVLLEGNRRAGKTSILKHLEGKTRIPGWLAVYSNLQGTDGAIGIPTPVVFRSIASDLAKSIASLNIETPLPDGTSLNLSGITEKAQKLKALKRCREACQTAIGTESPFADFRDYLELLLATLESRGLGLVLMLDEFDKLQEGIDSGVTSRQVPENIRFLIQNNPNFSAILTGSRRLKRLREEYWSALYGLGTSILVTALDATNARRVVTEPVRDVLTYSNEAIDRIVEMAAKQPFLLQLLCNRIFEYAAQTKIRSITLGIVNDVASDLVRGNEHFASLWDYAAIGPQSGRRRRQLILCWCAEAFSRGEQMTFAALHEQLAQYGIEVGDDALGDDLAYLRELELIDLIGAVGSGHYRLTIPMMADWIAQHQDPNELRSRARIEAEEENV
jgi:type I restriction enzyme M protein